MKDESPEKNPRRVLLTLDARRFSLATVDLAVTLAATVQTRLHGMFIEDENLLRAAELPCSREIGLMTAQERSSDIVRMQRSLRSMAEQFRRHLEQAALASNIPWSFESVRGRADEFGLTDELDVVYTILGELRSRRPVRGGQQLRKILLLPDHSLHVLSALEALLKGFGNDPVEITVINRSGQQSMDLSPALQVLLKAKGARVREFSEDQLTELLAKQDSSFDYAIVPRRPAISNLRQILKNLQCPLILVS